MTKLRGKVSWFGGPDDKGVSPSEGLAFIYDVSDAPELFLPVQPPNTTGLARRLNADEVYYVACRWDYHETPKASLIDMPVLVRATKTGREFVASPADWGPHQDTGRVADISPALMEALGIETDDEVEIVFPYGGVQEMAVPVCIDISHHQGFPDFDEVARSGVLGVIHKATEGTSFIDKNRAENCSNAIQAGLAVATYHWLSPGSDPRAQVEFYLSVVDPVRGERVVIDYEQDGCTVAMLKEAVQALMDYDYGLKITVYSGHLLKEQLGDKKDEFLAENTDLWLAQYTSSEASISWPDGTYPDWTLWQYSEKGSIPGISGTYVDLNNFNGTGDEFLEWISPSGSEWPKPEPPPIDESVVQVAIVAPEGTEVRVTVNDRVIKNEPSRLIQRLADLVTKGRKE